VVLFSALFHNCNNGVNSRTGETLNKFAWCGESAVLCDVTPENQGFGAIFIATNTSGFI
jgi:hypothetical protein